MVSASLLATVLGSATPASAAGTGLFPVNKPVPADKLSEAPQELPPLYSAEPLPAPAIVEASPSAGKPLRVVIPNIHQEQKPLPIKAVAAKEKTTQDDPQAAAASEASALRTLSHALYEKAQEIWSNGVMIADWSDTPIIRTMFKPNVPFAAIPPNWQVASATLAAANPLVAQDTQSIATLAPAAGAAESINTKPAVPIVPLPVAPKAPMATASAEPSQAVVVDLSEPAPALSSQSKAILAKVPAVTDRKPEKPLAKKVDIDRVKALANPVDTNAPPKVNDALGIKVGGTKTQMDVNYELERAYNALIAGKSETAIQIYEDILTGAPKNKEALFGLASTYHRLGQIDIARSLYGKLLALDPKHRDGLNNFLVLLADEAPQEALAQMERLEEQNPGFSPIPAQMAIIYQKLGDKEKAVEKMYRALAIAPENVTYRYNLAIMLDKSGKYAEAGKLYAQLLDSHAKGAAIPGDATKIQQRLTFISSNTR